MMQSSRIVSLARAPRLDLPCALVRRWLPGYVDGAMSDAGGLNFRSRVARHLDRCARCRAELQRYQALSRMLMDLPPAEPAEELGISIRLAVSRARETAGVKARLARYRTRMQLALEHVIEPLLLPVMGGALVALVLFGFVFPILGGGRQLAGTRPDLPLTLMQPARLETLAGFPIPVLDEAASRERPQGLLVEAMVNDQGQAVEYRVLGAPVDPGMQRQLDRVVLFSRFRPQMNFGRPTSGRIVLGFSQVLVRG
jgi:hypothetical protein